MFAGHNLNILTVRPNWGLTSCNFKIILMQSALVRTPWFYKDQDQFKNSSVFKYKI